MHPRFLDDVLTSRDFTDWEAFYSLEPFGYRAEWARFAKLIAWTLNAHRTSRTSPIAQPKDFMPDDSIDRPVAVQTMEEQKAQMFNLVAALKRDPNVKVVFKKRGQDNA